MILSYNLKSLKNKKVAVIKVNQENNKQTRQLLLKMQSCKEQQNYQNKLLNRKNSKGKKRKLKRRSNLNLQLRLHQLKLKMRILGLILEQASRNLQQIMLEEPWEEIMLMILILVESLDQVTRRSQALLVGMSSSSTLAVSNRRPNKSNQLPVEEISWISSEALI